VPTSLQDDKHGPLPRVLLLMTLVTGVVDAVSFLKLDHVFVANMTGNVVFLGFAAAEPRHFSIGASLTAIVAFMLGAVLGGRVVTHFGEHRGRLLATALYVEIALALAALGIAVSGLASADGPRAYALIVVLATAMGLQNSTARGVGVPDLSTTVLTSTLSSIAADSLLAGRGNPHIGRRVLAVAAMCVGAAIGALLTVKLDVTAALSAVVVLLALCGAMAHRLAASDATWTVDPARSA
jgi:uncharacterized membrane protein YoaK (UPF0700 family)